jgi:hypothetical protein
LSSSAARSAGDPAWQDFSLVLGGPLFQFLRRVRLSDDALGLLQRRLIVAVLLMWAPLLALSALEGRLVGDARAASFLNDIGVHLRFLVVTPLLILAELIVHLRMRPIVAEFRRSGLVRAEDSARCSDAMTEALRLRNSVLAEAILFALVYGVGVFFTLHRYESLGSSAWYASNAGGGRLSPAGLWLVFVSLPLLQFLLLRWYLRLFIWARFLWRMSHLDLDLNVLHPDKSGGLGFLSESLNAFLLIAAAHGVLFAGMMADRIFFGGAKLTDFEMEVFWGALFLVVVFAGPLTVFAPMLARLRRAGLRDYGRVAQGYVRVFRGKWIEGGAPADEQFVGSSDIQSLADLGNSYSVAAQTRLAPLSMTGVVSFVAAFLAPILPLTLTLMSPEKLLGQLLGLVF